jgi:uncharacterized protein (TIGR00290 family)
MKRTLLSWSSGKDSAWALHVLRRSGEYEVVELLTTFNAAFDRVAMHGVRRVLVERQAQAAGLPLWTVPLPWPCSNDQYEALMARACHEASERGVEYVAFGDLFLEDVRAYRERQLAGTGLTPVFPLWRTPTDELARQMIAAGLKATLTCVDMKQVDARFAGRHFDAQLLAELPAGIDACGENGEFHSFAHAGPMFSERIHVVSGETVVRESFVFADLLPDDGK